MESLRPAGPGAAVKAPEHLAEDGLYARLKEMPYLYKNKDSGISKPVQASADRTVSGGMGSSVRSPINSGKGSGGHEDEWRRLQIGFEAVFLKNRLTLHSLTNMGETDGMYKLENGPVEPHKDGLGHF